MSEIPIQEPSEDLKLNIKDMDGLIKKLKKNVTATESEYLEFISELSLINKEMGLANQKCENLEISLRESKEKEQNNILELKNQRQDLLQKMKEKESELDQKFQEVKEKLEISNDKIVDLETKNEELRQLSEWNELKQKEVNNKINFSLKQKDETIEELKAKLTDLETQISNSSLEQEDEEIENLHKEIRNLQEKLQDSQEDFKILNTQLEKNNALHAQQISFYNTQLKEAKAEQEDSQKAQESLMMAFKSLENKNNNTNIHEIVQRN